MRQSVRSSRRAMTEDQRASARSGLTLRLIDLVRERAASSVSCFLPTASEPDTRGFLAWAAEHEVETLLPSSREDGLLDWILPSGEGTTWGAHGIDEPLGRNLGTRGIERAELLLIPAAAVDLKGGRLGWGLGYFDRCLASLPVRPPIFAVVFEEDLRPSVPLEPHDVPLTGVVTPSRIVQF